jgi:glycosyltransferase involved in cell wall biosynthesis
LKVKVVGVADEPAIERYFQSEVEKHHLWNRIEFLGRVSEADLLSLYSRSFAVYYAPFDEDYGFVTLEALASGKPVVTAKDSGGVLAFIEDRQNGLIADPTEDSIADAFNQLWSNRGLYDACCSQARLPEEMVSWDEVAAALTRTISTRS